MTDWLGDNPFYVLIVVDEESESGATERRLLRLDLDEPGWGTTYADWLRRPGSWHLVSKENDGVVFSVVVHDGDQPYYVLRRIGNSATGDRLLKAYGLGKKGADGTMTRLWILETGQICGGEDVADFAVETLKRRVALPT